MKRLAILAILLTCQACQTSLHVLGVAAGSAVGGLGGPGGAAAGGVAGYAGGEYLYSKYFEDTDGMPDKTKELVKELVVEAVEEGTKKAIEQITGDTAENIANTVTTKSRQFKPFIVWGIVITVAIAAVAFLMKYHTTKKTNE